MSASFKIAQAADLLGVSDDTIRSWVEHGVLPVTDATPAEIPGEALAQQAIALAKSRTDATGVRSSARNRFTGLVTNVVIDTVAAQVEVDAGPHRIVPLMTAEAVRELGLEVGSLAVAVGKATAVIVEA